MKNELIDTFKHKGLRRNLIHHIRDKKIASEQVLDAMMNVPRHYFIDGAFLEKAYSDFAFPIGEGQTISQPSTVAIQTTLLDLKEGDKVLEIGTGSGYQTAVLCQFNVKVYSIERQKVLYQKTRKLLQKLGCKAETFYGDGYKGLPQFAPFDKIIITCGAPSIPEALIEQLKPGGKMIIPVGGDEYQDMKVISVDDQKNLSIENHGKFSFVPMLSEKSR
jgi:protein-L-isoaspartate(D-aspartate) O-methyltransferase